MKTLREIDVMHGMNTLALRSGAQAIDFVITQDYSNSPWYMRLVVEEDDTQPMLENRNFQVTLPGIQVEANDRIFLYVGSAHMPSNPATHSLGMNYYLYEVIDK